MNRQFSEDLDTDLARGHLLEWAELYALDAISTEERRVIDRFLEDVEPTTGATFADRVRTCRETVASAYAAEETDPPAHLFERIVAQLPGSQAAGSQAAGSQAAGSQAAGSRTAAGTAGVARTASSAGARAGEAGEVPDELANRRTARASRSSRAARWLVAASAAVLLTVGGVTIAQNLQQTTVEEQVLQASDVRTEKMPLQSGGTADLAVSGEKDAAVVTLSGVPAPAEGFVYQMWRIPADGTAPVSVSTMTGQDVSGGTVTELPDIGGFSALAITVEPEGGSATPTLPIVAEIPLDA